MTSEETYKFLVDHLVSLLENTDLVGKGAKDIRVDKFLEAELCDMFERYIYGDMVSFFLINKSERMQVFNGKYYESAMPEMLSQVIKRTMKRLDIGIVYQKNSYQKIANECIEAMKVCGKVEFKPDRNYIAFNNGIFNLKSRQLCAFDNKYKTDIYLDFNYSPGFKNALWDQKLEEIIPNNEMREALQMFFGCLLLKREEVKVEYVCFLLGAGGNGKSVLVNAVVNMFGSDLFSKFSPDQLFRSQQSMYHLAELDGKLANFCDDVSNKDFSGGEFKSFVSGEEFQARHPYGSRIFKVKAPFLICCANEMPPTTDDSEGFHRRFLPITSSDVTRRGKNKDPELTFKLRAPEVKQAIFNWVLEGYYKVIECHGNIEVGQSVVETQKLLREDSNSVRRWIRDVGLVRVEPISAYEKRWRKLTEWYSDYKKYCEENGERNPQKSSSLSRLFKSMNFVYERRSTGVWFCIGYEDEEESKTKKEDPSNWLGEDDSEEESNIREGIYDEEIQEKPFRTKQEETMNARREYREREEREEEMYGELPF